MKTKKTNISSFVAVAMVSAFSLSVVSCSESDEMGEGKYTVSLSPHKLKVSSGSSMKTKTDDDNNFIGYEINETTGHAMTYGLNIDAENTPWKFTDIPDWIKLSPASGSASETIKMTVDANSPTETERQTTIVLKSTDPEWEYSLPITVKQVAASASLSTKDYFSSFSSEGGTKDCHFSANFIPKIEYVDNSDNWFHASIEKTSDEYNNMPLYTMHVTVSANEETASRTGYILLKFNGEVKKKIEVSQYAFYPSSSISNSSMYISSEGATNTLTYSANFTPTIQYDEIKNWCDVSLDTNAKTITLNVKPNKEESTRSGYLYLMYKGQKMESVKVYQYAFSPKASFGSNNTYIDKKGGTLTLDYTANFIPTVKCDEEWCDVSINTSTKKVTMNVKPNTNSRPRYAYIYLLYKGEEKASLRLVQDI